MRHRVHGIAWSRTSLRRPAIRAACDLSFSRSRPIRLFYVTPFRSPNELIFPNPPDVGRAAPAPPPPINMRFRQRTHGPIVISAISVRFGASRRPRIVESMGTTVARVNGLCLGDRFPLLPPTDNPVNDFIRLQTTTHAFNPNKSLDLDLIFLGGDQTTTNQD